MCLRRLAAAAALWSGAVRHGAAFDDLAVDDECSTDAGCAVSALQRRAAAQSVGASVADEANASLGKWDLEPGEPLRILFVGNSFTYGPREFSYDGSEQPLHNLPRLFKFVAESLGQKVQQAEDTLGGCTLWTHRPSMNPDMCKDADYCQTIDMPRVNRSEECTVSAEIRGFKEDYSPCPQRLLRSEYGSWDAIVLQDHSSLPGIEKARREMYYPAIAEFAKAAKHLQKKARKRKPLIALYMTWSYMDGGLEPGHGKRGCWVKDQADLARESRGDNYMYKMQNSACQGYALASGVASGMHFGGDVLIPAGLAWQVARGSPAIPSGCKQAVDDEYGGEPQLGSLDLPLRSSDEQAVRWRGEQAKHLFRDKGPDYESPYCPGCTIDHHASATGMYLNALVFYATLTKKSPIGAAVPDGIAVVDGMRLPYVSPEDGHAMQRIAHDVVMGHMDTWWKGDLQPADPCKLGDC